MQFGWLTGLFGDYPVARSIHLAAMIAIALFIVVHVGTGQAHFACALLYEVAELRGRRKPKFRPSWHAALAFLYAAEAAARFRWRDGTAVILNDKSGL